MQKQLRTRKAEKIEAKRTVICVYCDPTKRNTFAIKYQPRRNTLVIRQKITMMSELPISI